jgi:predicted hotdog family 3-hydroxylacyl-ACP dehydratase
VSDSRNPIQPTTKKHFTIAEVVPHDGVMSLLDAVLDYDDESLKASVTIHSNSVFLDGDSVPAWVGIEYMAQAIAAYSGVQRRLTGREVKVGFLVGTRRYNCSHAHFPLGTELNVSVVREFQADNGLGSFACSIEGILPNGEAASVDASLNVFLPENVEEFLAS